MQKRARRRLLGWPGIDTTSQSGSQSEPESESDLGGRPPPDYMDFNDVGTPKPTPSPSPEKRYPDHHEERVGIPTTYQPEYRSRYGAPSVAPDLAAEWERERNRVYPNVSAEHFRRPDAAEIKKNLFGNDPVTVLTQPDLEEFKRLLRT